MALKHWEEIKDSASKKFGKLGYQLLGEESHYGQIGEMPGHLLLKRGEESYLVSIIYFFSDHSITNIEVGGVGIVEKDKSKLTKIAEGYLPISLTDRIKTTPANESAANQIKEDVTEVYKAIISEEGIQF